VVTVYTGSNLTAPQGSYKGVVSPPPATPLGAPDWLPPLPPRQLSLCSRSLPQSYWNPGYGPDKNNATMYGDMCIVSLDSAAPFTPALLATAATAQSVVETVIGRGRTESTQPTATLQ